MPLRQTCHLPCTSIVLTRRASRADDSLVADTVRRSHLHHDNLSVTFGDASCTGRVGNRRTVTVHDANGTGISAPVTAALSPKTPPSSPTEPAVPACLPPTRDNGLKLSASRTQKTIITPGNDYAGQRYDGAGKENKTIKAELKPVKGRPGDILHDPLTCGNTLTGPIVWTGWFSSEKSKHPSVPSTLLYCHCANARESFFRASLFQHVPAPHGYFPAQAHYY